MLLAGSLPRLTAAESGPPLYGEQTPSSELITLPVPGAGWVSFRAERVEAKLWGQELVALLYSGSLARGQSERHDGRYSLILVPRNPAAEVQFLEREVWPALGTPFMSAGGFRGLEPGQVPEPDDARLDRLQQNLLRAAWYPLAEEMGLTGSLRSPAAAGAFRRFQSEVIAEEERNGFLHEAQHALDEAWKSHPERYRRLPVDAAEAELRAALAALAHSATPHYALYQSVRQYRQRLDPYQAAVGQLLGLLAAEVLSEPRAFGRVRPERNIPLQLPRLLPEQLRSAAARAMARRFAPIDEAAGYALSYDAGVTAGALRVGSLRGRVLPADLPPPGKAGPVAAWEAVDGRVVSHGVHIYLAERGVQPAIAGDLYGLALGEGGYAALLLAPPSGPWRLRIRGGLFRQGETAGATLPMRVEAGEGLAVEMQPQAGAVGWFEGLIPATAAREGMLRLILQRAGEGGAPAFLAGFSIEPAAP